MNTIIRKYNYRLETGTVGTDDDNIATILYNINRMEMRKSFTSSDAQELDKALGNLFFMIADAKVHLIRFLKIFGDKTKEDTVQTVMAALDDAIETVRNARLDKTTDMAKISAAYPKVYKNLLDIVPSVLALDAQAVGRI